jgi:hypothetical protein
VYFHASRYFLLIEIALEVVFLADGYYHHRNVQSRCWQCRVRMSLGSRAGKYHLPVLLLGGNICRFDIRMLHVLCRHIFCRECNYVCCLSLCQPGVRRRRLVSGANDGIGWTLIYATTVQGTIVVLDTSTSDVSTLYSYITEGVEYDNLFGIAVNDEAVYAFGGTLCDILVVKNGTASTYGSCNSSEFSSNTYGAITVNAGGYVFFPAEVSGVTKIAMVVIYGESYESMTFCHTDGFVSSLEVDLSTNLLYFVTPYGVYVVNITAAEEFGGLPEPELLIDIYVDQEFGFVRDFAMAPNGGMMLVATNGTYFLGPNASYSKMSTATLFGAALGSDNLFYATGYGQLHIFKGEFVK